MPNKRTDDRNPGQRDRKKGWTAAIGTSSIRRDRQSERQPRLTRLQ